VSPLFLPRPTRPLFFHSSTTSWYTGALHINILHSFPCCFRTFFTLLTTSTGLPTNQESASQGLKDHPAPLWRRMRFLLGSPCPSCVRRGKAQSCSCDISAYPGKNKANQVTSLSRRCLTLLNEHDVWMRPLMACTAKAARIRV
jgi:hypothetical protein